MYLGKDYVNWIAKDFWKDYVNWVVKDVLRKQLCLQDYIKYAFMKGLSKLDYKECI